MIILLAYVKYIYIYIYKISVKAQAVENINKKKKISIFSFTLREADYYFKIYYLEIIKFVTFSVEREERRRVGLERMKRPRMKWLAFWRKRVVEPKGLKEEKRRGRSL